MVAFSMYRGVLSPRWLTIGAFAVLLLAAAGLLVALIKEPSIHRGIIALVYLAALGFMAVHDAVTLRVPNRVVYTSLAFAVVASLTLGRSDAREALLGGLVVFGLMLVAAIAGRGAMGFADVKVGTLCGIAVGLGGVLPLFFITFVGAALTAAVLLAFRLRKRKDVVALTPFLVAATAFSMFYYHLYLLS